MFPRAKKHSPQTNKAILTLVGTTVGAGMFGLPYVTAQVGLPLGLVYLLLLGGITLIVNLAYGEVALRTEGDKQLPGYARHYLGRKGYFIASFLLVAGLYGSMLAYLVKIGEFIALLFPQYLTPTTATMIFYILAAWTIFYGLKTVSVVESFLTSALIALIIILSLVSLGKIQPINWVTNLSWDQIFLPYGVFLFSLAGSSIIPEMEEILRHEPQNLKKSIIWGTTIPVVLYAIFIAVVVGISGEHTSDEAISGLLGLMPAWIVVLGALIGVLAMATSFLSLGYVLREHFYRDFHLPRPQAWALACLVPLILLLLGFNNFILILSITGALAIGLQGIVILVVYLVAQKNGDKKPAFAINLNHSWVLLFSLIFIGGVYFALTKGI